MNCCGTKNWVHGPSLMTEWKCQNIEFYDDIWVESVFKADRPGLLDDTRPTDPGQYLPQYWCGGLDWCMPGYSLYVVWSLIAHGTVFKHIIFKMCIGNVWVNVCFAYGQEAQQQMLPKWRYSE